MSDCGVVLYVTRKDAEALETREVEAIQRACTEQRTQGVGTDALGAPFLWRATTTSAGVTIVLSEYWGEQAAVLVVEADGSIRPATYSRIEIEGEEMDVPEIPEGNPPPDAILDALLESDLGRAKALAADAGRWLSPALACRAVAEAW